MSVQPTAEECEFLGDEAAGAGQLEKALDHYSQARQLRCDALTMALAGDDLDSQSMSTYGTDSARLNQKIRTIVDELNPPKTLSERIAVGGAAYVRFHGTAGKYWGRYSDEDLSSWADWLIGQARSGRSAWAYFNNDIFGHAIEDALTLKSMVGQMFR